MIKHRKVKTVSGVHVQIKAHTFCVHGDNPEAIKLLKSLRKGIEANESGIDSSRIGNNDRNNSACIGFYLVIS